MWHPILLNDIKNGPIKEQEEEAEHYNFFKFQTVPNTDLSVSETIHDHVSVNVKNVEAKKRRDSSSI